MIYSRSTCRICGRTIARTHFKRHVNAHERNGVATDVVNAEWSRHVDAIEHERDILRKLDSRQGAAS